MRPRRGDFVRSFLRGFAVQGSWNPSTFQGAGFAYGLLPLLRRIHAGDPVALREAVRRHMGPLNVHPYLAHLALGALARLEHEGEDPELIRRFRTAIAPPLGALGDRLVWVGWRPFCLLSAILAYSLGGSPPVVAVLFLLVYNAGHLTLRLWGFRHGWNGGIDAVLQVARRSPARLVERLRWVNVALAGATAAFLALPFLEEIGRLPGALACLGVVVAARRWPAALSGVAVALLATAAFWSSVAG